MNYDALLVVSFGGPEGMNDVLPFLENVLRGRNVPRERMLEVAEHYARFGGVSPINQQTRDLIAALRVSLDEHRLTLPIYWGNRNWHPFLKDTLAEMRDAGVKRALAFVVAGYSSYSSCRQYRENIQEAQLHVGPQAPEVDKIRVFFNHPRFITATADRVREAFDRFPEAARSDVSLVFTAHSIPGSMAASCLYEPQLREACRLTATACGVEPGRWSLVYQSRSGRPEDPWLEPDVSEYLRALHDAGRRKAIIMPIGFLSDHLEVLFDLDVAAREVCDSLGMEMVRASTVGTHPEFVTMIRDLIEERIDGVPRRAIGDFGASHDTCPVDCCPAPQRKRPGT